MSGDTIAGGPGRIERGRRAARARAGVVLAVAAGLAVPLVPAALDPSGAAAAVEAVGSWSIERDGAGVVVRWTGPEALPMGAERIEIRAGADVLGVGRETGTGVELRLDRVTRPLTDLSAWRGGTRLDAEPETPAGGAAGAPVERDRPHTRHLGVDAGTPGPYDTRRLDYTLAPLAHPDVVEPLEVTGEVTVPIGAPGARPLVLVLHGRHGTCFQGGPAGEISGDWPCPPGWDPVPSHRGYRAITDLLASQGYVTVSIAANAVNAQDFALPDGGAGLRSALVRHHLAVWTWWSVVGGDPFGGILRGHVDLRRVVLIGHSRGGEGVARAAVESRPTDPWRVVGLVPVGPTAFGRQVAAGIDTMVLLPRCDGDVADLEGQLYVDDGRDLLTPSDRALRSSVLLLGANHNWFNSEWTPGQAAAPAFDDWSFVGRDDDPICGPASPRRLSPERQQAAGATYVASFLRLVIDRDPTMLHQLDNGYGAPASAKGAAVLVTAIGGDRRLLYAPRRAGRFAAGVGMTSHVCEGWSFTGAPSCGFDFESRTPHWIPPIYGTELPRAVATELEWEGRRRFTLTAKEPIDLRGKDRIDLRIAVDPEADPTWYRARLTDDQGRTAWLPVSAELRGLAGTGLPAKVWAQAARLKVRGVTGVDLRRIVRVDVEATAGADGLGRGHAYLLDAMVLDERLPGVVPVTLPRATLRDRELAEGDADETIAVPIRLAGHATRAGRFWAEAIGPSGSTSGWVEVAPGARTATLELPVLGDTVRTGDQIYSVILFPGRNVTTGRWWGTVRIVDDEPAPVITIDDTTASAVEGGTLEWSLSLSAPPGQALSIFAPFVVPSTGTELDSDDVSDEAWAVWVGADKPSPPQTLSSSFAFQLLEVAPGETTATVRVPTVADGVAEGTETVAVELYFEGTFLGTVTGTVTD